ncbi:hypothetical protein QUF74_00620 [Candidatus Halobeggiatoa sp. HSG11]|nr:hypothetical protein [Candidatus Halobeggiatoa sp. HSG11]
MRYSFQPDTSDKILENNQVIKHTSLNGYIEVTYSNESIIYYIPSGENTFLIGTCWNDKFDFIEKTGLNLCKGNLQEENGMLLAMIYNLYEDVIDQKLLAEISKTWPTLGTFINNAMYSNYQEGALIKLIDVEDRNYKWFLAYKVEIFGEITIDNILLETKLVAKQILQNSIKLLYEMQNKDFHPVSYFIKTSLHELDNSIEPPNLIPPINPIKKIQGKFNPLKKVSKMSSLISMFALIFTFPFVFIYGIISLLTSNKDKH